MTDQRAAPAPLDPIVSLAVAIAESPGAYAFLLGAGVSRDAGVPTGGEVLKFALNDLYRLNHPDTRPPDEETLAAWATETGYGQLTYSEILEHLGPDPEGRRAYLAKYFEGRDPGETHRLLARLAADGLARIFVTTNFDRLLEQALGEVGITPVVITAADDLRRVSEREHAPCYVLKVHGDYLQQTIRNTAAELAKLDPEIEAELQEVFDRFGLVALGYSGSDAAVGHCLRKRNSRYGAYWVSRGEPREAVAALVESLQARVVRRDTASAFLADLDRRIAAFRQHPSGETPDVVKAEVLKLLRQGDSVGLREKLLEEWRALEGRVHDVIEPRARSQSVEVEVARVADAELIPAFERMLAALFPLIDHDESLFGEQVNWMRRIVDRAKEGDGGWPELPQWAVWFLAQACGAYAMSRDRFTAVAALLQASVEDRKIGDSLATLVPCDVGQLIAAGALEPSRRRDSGAEWVYLVERLSESTFLGENFPELVEPPRRAARWADDFSFLTSLAAVRAGHRVIGYWRMDHDGAESLARRLARDLTFSDEVASKCFGISGDELRATIKPTMLAAINEPGKLIYTPGGSWGISDAVEYLPEPPGAPTSS
jgi:SIR2-like domain